MSSDSVSSRSTIALLWGVGGSVGKIAGQLLVQITLATSSRNNLACSVRRSALTSESCSRTSRGSSPEAERTAIPVAMRRLSPCSKPAPSSSPSRLS